MMLQSKSSLIFMQQEIKIRIDYLKKEIIYHDNLYYNKNSPKISDGEYDNLVKELEFLERKNPFFLSRNSPTQKVPGYTSKLFKYVKHSSPMLSLSNTYSQEETVKWCEKVEKNLNDKSIKFIVEPKIDGVSACLTYVGGILTTGATRGDGKVGEDVTLNIKTIKNIPHRLQIDNPPSFFDLRGEVYIDKLDFKKLNEKILELGGQKFANPRNAASGSLRQKKLQVTSERNLRLFVHSFGKIYGRQFETQFDFLHYCKKCGFQLQDDLKICSSLKEVVDFIDVMISKRNLLPYEIDGLVVKINNLKLQKKMGWSSKSPRWAIAFKFPAKQATSILKKICVQVGRTGVITPTAIFEPVTLAGVKISRATLHNFKEIVHLNINEGDTILLERAGDVIPKIIKVVKKASIGVFATLQNCPACFSKIVKEKEVTYRCINPECPAQFREHLIHFVSRNAMNIKGFGKALIDQLIKRKKLQVLADIYNLTFNDFIKLDLFKEKKTYSILKAIGESKKQPLSKLLFAFGIRHIGEKTSEIVAKKFGNMKALLKASVEDFTKICEIGDVIAESLNFFFGKEAVHHLIDSLSNVGVNMIEDRKEQLNNKLNNKVFVLTGQLKNFTREEAKKIIRSFGGRIRSYVSTKTDYLITGSNLSLKLEQAEKLNIKIIDEMEFIRLIER
ncbi:MAG: NAD-dependent DNA ligase LigA [Endomicrobium sp.]|jgi:DNA ligase (NAD+)|nr:NAD-dependent DNA ligase LigA [Endomicrobium sp.]